MESGVGGVGREEKVEGGVLGIEDVVEEGGGGVVE